MTIDKVLTLFIYPNKSEKMFKNIYDSRWDTGFNAMSVYM